MYNYIDKYKINYDKNSSNYRFHKSQKIVLKKPIKSEFEESFS